MDISDNLRRFISGLEKNRTVYVFSAFKRHSFKLIHDNNRLANISVSVPPTVTAVARKRSRSFCEKLKIRAP